MERDGARVKLPGKQLLAGQRQTRKSSYPENDSLPAPITRKVSLPGKNRGARGLPGHTLPGRDRCCPESIQLPGTLSVTRKAIITRKATSYPEGPRGTSTCPAWSPPDSLSATAGGPGHRLTQSPGTHPRSKAAKSHARSPTGAGLPGKRALRTPHRLASGGASAPGRGGCRPGGRPTRAILPHAGARRSPTRGATALAAQGQSRKMGRDPRAPPGESDGPPRAPPCSPGQSTLPPGGGSCDEDPPSPVIDSGCMNFYPPRRIIFETSQIYSKTLRSVLYALVGGDTGPGVTRACSRRPPGGWERPAGASWHSCEIGPGTARGGSRDRPGTLDDPPGDTAHHPGEITRNAGDLVHRPGLSIGGNSGKICCLGKHHPGRPCYRPGRDV